ncbi:hypothetical protein PR001_g9748 [Phytophthora rubi]|uniref:Uncharacterized protein n=1 Tax=Phytophthora rubi TaxID=129364 RepID=A0A6A3MS23_9STRA|nr:hypothetical protein PR001_g9748 [Phytophthora rubi]
MPIEEYNEKCKGTHQFHDGSGKVTAVMDDSGLDVDGTDIPAGCGVDVETGEVKGDKEALSPERNESSVGSHRTREDGSDASSYKRSRSDSNRPIAYAGTLSCSRRGDDSTPSGDTLIRCLIRGYPEQDPISLWLYCDTKSVRAGYLQ